MSGRRAMETVNKTKKEKERERGRERGFTSCTKAEAVPWMTHIFWRRCDQSVELQSSEVN